MIHTNYHVVISLVWHNHCWTCINKLKWFGNNIMLYRKFRKNINNADYNYETIGTYFKELIGWKHMKVENKSVYIEIHILLN